jgi:hypothetical protein
VGIGRLEHYIELVNGRNWKPSQRGGENHPDSWEEYNAAGAGEGQAKTSFVIPGHWPRESPDRWFRLLLEALPDPTAGKTLLGDLNL